MKRLFLLFLLFGTVILLSGCVTTTTTTTTSATGSTTTTTEELEYADFASLHITEVGDQLMMPERTYYVYYYGVECTHCIEIKQTVLHTVQGLRQDKFYFVVCSSRFDVVDSIYPQWVEFTPTVIKVVNGAVTAHYVGKSEILPLLSTLS